jgi:uncharacterized membrane protein
MTTALFLAALISDLAYAQTFEIQWANFSAWLIAGGLVIGALVLLLALIGLFRKRDGTRPGLLRRPGRRELLLTASFRVVG